MVVGCNLGTDYNISCCLQDVLNTYCWIHSTYTIPSAFWKRIGGQGTAGMDRVVTVTVQVLMLLTPASTRQ